MIPTISSMSIGNGKPLVLLHAFPLSHLMWQDFKVPSGYRLILPDFPGFGFSSTPSNGLTLSEAAQGLENHLFERGMTEPITLGGISMGGYWAMEYIRQFPDKILKVIFISTRPSLDKPEAKQNRLNMAKRVKKEGVEFLASAMIPGLLGKTTLANKSRIIERLQHWIQMVDPIAIVLAQRAMAERRDQNDLMSRLTVPVLVIAGNEDSLIPAADAESMSKAIPNSQLKVMEQAGHLVPLENPIQFQNIVNEFISKST